MKLYNSDGTLFLDIEVDDTSYRNKQMMGENVLELHYSMTEYKEMPVGVYCDFEGERYTLESPCAFNVQSERNYEYTATMYGAQSHLKKYRVRDTTIQNRLKFSYTATPLQHLKLLIKNMNRRESGWNVGSCIEATEATVSYNHTNCLEALQQIADAFSTEWEIDGKTINLRRIEYNKTAPLALHYGKDGGFLPGVGRENYGDSRPVEILFVQGGSRNIDGLKYGSTELLLPKSQTISFDGNYFEDEAGFDPAHARRYTTDNEGVSLQRSDKALSSYVEDSVDLSDIYPSRVGTVSAVQTQEGTDNDGNPATLYDIVDNDIPEALNFEDYLIDGETMTIIFQSGILTGREFDVKYVHEGRRFEIVPTTIDGAEMPSAVFTPSVGDTYAVFGCMLPDAYICDNTTKSGASWDLFREAVRTLYTNEDQKYTFNGELDGQYAAKHWLEVGGKIKVGGYVLFTSDKFIGADGILIRQTGIKTYVNKPKKPVIELSNQATSGTSIAAALDRIGQEEVVREELLKSLRSFTKRTFADAKEMQEMLEKAIDNFSPGIDPIWVRTMSVLVGNEYQQFEFVDNKTESQKEVVPAFAMDNSTKVFNAPATILKHCTLGIENTSSAHKASEYKYWDMAAYTSPALTDSAKAYYLTAKCAKNGTNGTFMLQENYAYDPGDGYYYFLVGVVSSERDGGRSFATCYGYTEILPGQVRIKLIISPDGKTYFNVAEGEIGGNIKILAGSSGYNNLIDKPDLSVYETRAEFNVFANTINGQVSSINTSLGATKTDLSNLNTWTQNQINSVNNGLTSANNKIYALQTAGFITQATGNTLYASAQLANGNKIISYINQTATTTTISASKINLVGAVTFNMFATDAQNKVNTATNTANAAATTANSVNSSLTSLKGSLKSLAYKDMVEQAQLGETIVKGGYIKAELLNVTHIEAVTGHIGGIDIHDGYLGDKSESGDGVALYSATNDNIPLFSLNKWTRSYFTHLGTYNNCQDFISLEAGGTDYGVIRNVLIRSNRYTLDEGGKVALYIQMNNGYIGETAILATHSASGSERRFEVTFRNVGDADWYQRVCIRATILPTRAQLENLPNTPNPIFKITNGTSTATFWNVLWDSRSGCFCLGSKD